MSGLSSWSPFAGAGPLLEAFCGGSWPVRALPSWEMREDAKAYVVRMDLPGYGPEELEVRIRDGVLQVSGRHMEEGVPSEGSQESFCGSFSRSFLLPAFVEAESVRASYAKGVLYLMMFLCVPMGCLQLYWMGLIMLKVHSMMV